MTFRQKLDAIVEKNNSLVCVGLDSDEKKISGTQFAFNKAIIDATHDLVCAFKPNSAFYEGSGAKGVEQLKLTCDYIRETYPDVVIILDAKRADIGNTNEGYARYVYEYLGADAVTLQPYFGKESLKPFLDLKDKGCFILCRTSNPGAGEFQDLTLSSLDTGLPAIAALRRKQAGNQAVKLYQQVAKNVAEKWNENGNCALVVGATYPAELEIVRRIVGDMPILIPGVGAQGGDVEKTVKAGVDSHGKNAIINSSRGIIFAQNPREEAKKLCDEINKYRI